MSRAVDQLVLPLMGDLSANELTLELKPYIQPFERVLASAELAGLIPELQNESLWTTQSPDVLQIRAGADLEHLSGRLAYWQRVGRENLSPTLQVLLEATDNGRGIGRMPTSRKLRYGPHDLHEYRGKFFPQLVRSLINFAGLRRGSLVLDPTCGSGTTNCEARVLGMRSVSLDLNPLSVLIARTKAGLIAENPDRFDEGISRFLELLDRSQGVNPESLWTEEELDYLLRWFAPEALSETASIVRHIQRCTDEDTSRFLTVCLSNIVRGVSWQLESDLRVRKRVYDYTSGSTYERFTSEVQRQRAKIEPYLRVLYDEQVETCPTPGDIRVGDARVIHNELREYRGQCDALITSPPYATALPYLDTDRLSLMVLRLLDRPSVRQREREMIGNREVSEKARAALWEDFQRRCSELPKDVRQLVEMIAKTNHGDNVGFRRRNLPALLGRYFLDMSSSLRNARRLMKPGTYAFYVVGNNSTLLDGEKLEIPTDEFLWQIGENVGWHCVDKLDMELLPSRDIFRNNRGSSEKILVFRSTVERRSIYSVPPTASEDERDGSWDFRDADTREHLHTLHPYPARFIPQIPRRAIQEYSEPNDVVLDPFSGSGTTALESILLGRRAVGVDNNAVADLVARAKTTRYTRRDFKRLTELCDSLSKLDRRAPEGLWRPEYKNVNYWFAEAAIGDLARLRWAINELPRNPRLLALAIFSSIVVRSSRQDSDTRYKRTDRAYEAGDAIRYFEPKMRDAIGRAESLRGQHITKADLFLHDAKRLPFLENGSVDLIVTSPPYLNAYDYHKYHRHRLHWVEGDVAMARDLEIGKHDTFTRKNATPDRYFEEMEACFDEWRRVLRVGGTALVVVGDAIVSGQAVPVADRFTELLDRKGFRLESHSIREIKRVQKSFGVGARAEMEHILIYSRR